MTAVIDPATPVAPPLTPVTVTLRAMFGTDNLPGLAAGLVVADETGWVSASELAEGTRIPALLAAAQHRWHASPHAAAALAWKAYTYWLALPAVLGWAVARRVPLLSAPDVLVRLEDHRPLLTVGLRRSTPVAVLPSDPLATAGLPEVRVVPDEAALLAELRASLLDGHLTPMLTAIHREVRVGGRTLMGSVASGVAYAVLRAGDVLPGSPVAAIEALLRALDIEDLIELVPDGSGNLSVQRKTCCLAFTLPQPKICAGCCVR